MQALPGFRDYFPEDCARRNHIVSVWRDVARRYGFVEYDAPVLESLELYAKKNSGGEILSQLFQFTDKGGRDVVLRPEMTPSLARMIAARERNYRKPLKWFCASPFFRYEKQQKGRLREFWQFNADIVGESGSAADAELIALAIDMMRAFGFTAADFMVRLSNRQAWMDFLQQKTGKTDEAAEFLAIVDKIEREDAGETHRKLEPFGCTTEEVRAFIASGGGEAFTPLLELLDARGMRDFVKVDLTIVRGLAYYTGIVFEIFDCGKSMRALAGGGRYDRLLAELSGGATDLPAIGFGMGDVVLGNFIDATPSAAAVRDALLQAQGGAEVFVVIADEQRRPEALGLLQNLRDAGWRANASLAPAKVGKQFQNAEQLGARFAVVVGAEWPEVKVKALATRAEQPMAAADVVKWLSDARVSKNL